MGSEDEGGKNKMEGIASVALLPSGSISGHFIHLPNSTCYGLHGTELSCERECSRGEDYRLIKLSIIDYSRKKEQVVVVECRGHDAARFQNVEHAHGICCSEMDTRGKRKLHERIVWCDSKVCCLHPQGCRLKSGATVKACCLHLQGCKFKSWKLLLHIWGWEEDVVGMVQQKHGKHNISISFACETLKADDAAEEHLKKYMPHLVGQDAVVNIGQMSISGVNFEGDEESLGESSGVNLEGDGESLGESSEG